MPSKIGEILIGKGLLTPEKLEEALAKQAQVQGRLGTVLVEMGAVEVDQVAEALAEQRGFPAATRKDFEAATAITLVCIPAPFAQQFKAFPLRREAGKLVIAFASPWERSQLEPVRSMAGMELVPCVAPELLLLYYQEMRYRLKRPVRFANWSPAPTRPGVVASGAATPSRAPASSALPSVPGVPAPPPSRFATSLFGAPSPSLSKAPPASSTPAAAAPAPQPKFSIPPPASAPGAAASPAAPTAPTSTSSAPRFSILDPKPSAGAPKPVTIPPPPAKAPTAASPIPGVPPPPAASPLPKRLATPAPFPGIPAPPVAAPAPKKAEAAALPSAPAPLPAPPFVAPAAKKTEEPFAARSPLPPAPHAAPFLAAPAAAPVPKKIEEPAPLPPPPAVAPATRRSEDTPTVRALSPLLPETPSLHLPFSELPAAAPVPKKADEPAHPVSPLPPPPAPAPLFSQPEPVAPAAPLPTPPAGADESATRRVDSVVVPEEARGPAPTPLAATVEMDPFATPGLTGQASHDGPTVPISPELQALALQAQVIPGSLEAAAPAGGQDDSIIEGEPLGDLEPSSSEPGLESAPEAAAPPAEPPQSTTEQVTIPRRTTKEDLPAAILASEVESGLKVAEERRDFEDEVTVPRRFVPRAIQEGTSLESEPAAKNAVTTAPYGKPDGSTAESPKVEVSADLPAAPMSGPQPVPPEAEQNFAKLAAELSEPTPPPGPRPVPPPEAQAAKPVEKPAPPAPIVEKAAPPPARPQPKRRPEVSDRPVVSVARPAPEGNKLFLGMGIGAAAALLLGGAGVLVAWPKAKPEVVQTPVVCKECPPLPPAPPDPVKVSAETADGTVERLGPNGEWEALSAGSDLADGELVRTGAASRAKLRVGAGAVVVGEFSRLALRGATTAAHRFRLGAGFASVQYAAAKVPVEIELAGGKVLVSGQADLTLFADDLRTALSPRAGSVTVSGPGDKKVELPSGKQVVVSADGTFTDAGDLPASLELNLEPPRASPETHEWMLEGSIVGGPARVVVEGAPVTVDADNRFSHALKMPAKGPFNAAAVDIAGHRLSQTFPSTAGAAKQAAKKPGPAAPKKAPPKGAKGPK